MVVKIYFPIIFSSCLTCQAQPARAGMCSGLPPYCATLRLPALGYTFVFPFGHALSRGCSLPVDCAQLIRRISPTCSSFGAALRQSISTFPEGLDSPFGLPSAVFLSTFDYLALRAAFGRQCWFASSRDVSPFGLLIQPAAQPPCCLVPSQPPLACVQVCLLRSRSCRPTGCLRQATQPAPAGMCSGFRFQVSGFCFPPPTLIHFERSPSVRSP